MLTENEWKELDVLADWLRQRNGGTHLAAATAALTKLMESARQTPAISKDPTSGYYVPANLEDWKKLLEGTGIPLPESAHGPGWSWSRVSGWSRSVDVTIDKEKSATSTTFTLYGGPMVGKCQRCELDLEKMAAAGIRNHICGLEFPAELAVPLADAVDTAQLVSTLRDVLRHELAEWIHRTWKDQNPEAQPPGAYKPVTVSIDYAQLGRIVGDLARNGAQALIDLPVIVPES